MRIFELEKKLDIGEYGIIYLMSWADDFLNFREFYFCIYFPKTQNGDYKITIENFESSLNEYNMVKSDSFLQSILEDYISDSENKLSSNNIFKEPEDAIFSVFKKLYSSGKFVQERQVKGE